MYGLECFHASVLVTASAAAAVNIVIEPSISFAITVVREEMVFHPVGGRTLKGVASIELAFLILSKLQFRIVFLHSWYECIGFLVTIKKIGISKSP